MCRGLARSADLPDCGPGRALAVGVQDFPAAALHFPDRVAQAPAMGHDTITLSEARSRLDQRRFSRPNTHFSAFFEIYKNIIFSPANFAKFLQNFCKILQFFAEICKFAREKMIFL